MHRELLNIYSWLTQFSGSYLSTEAQTIKDLAVNALESGDHEFTKQALAQLRNRANSDAQGWEKTELKIICATLAFYIEDHSLSLHLLYEALKEGISNQHFFAVMQWMLGYVYWHMAGFKSNAIYACTRSLVLFNTLAFSNDENLDISWYQKKHDYISQVLYFSRRKGRYILNPRPSNIEHRSETQPRPSKPATWPTTRPPGKPKPRPPIVNRRFPVIERIPAGGLHAIKPDEIEFTEIDQLIINGEKYFIQNLLDQGEVNIQGSMNYLIAHIHGDSMNQLDIHDGDYVLVQLQNTANHMDIVLATGLTEFEEVGKATLKRYVIRGSTVELRPESDNPQHENILITKGDPLNILGIAIAVLKPLEEENEQPKTT